jgi:hypothetical protein
MFTALLRSNCSGADHIENTVLLLRACILRALSRNGRSFQSHCLVMGLYATIATICKGHFHSLVVSTRNISFWKLSLLPSKARKYGTSARVISEFRVTLIRLLGIFQRFGKAFSCHLQTFALFGGF